VDGSHAGIELIEKRFVESTKLDLGLWNVNAAVKVVRMLYHTSACWESGRTGNHERLIFNDYEYTYWTTL
jgi:hypothetical protein